MPKKSLSDIARKTYQEAENHYYRFEYKTALTLYVKSFFLEPTIYSQEKINACTELILRKKT